MKKREREKLLDQVVSVLLFPVYLVLVLPVLAIVLLARPSSRSSC